MVNEMPSREQKPPTVLDFDNKDDRYQIHRVMLPKLPPAKRVEFLAWACTQSNLKKFREPLVVGRATWELLDKARWDSSADAALTVDVAMSFWALSMQFNLNLKDALTKLEELVKLVPRRDR